MKRIDELEARIAELDRKWEAEIAPWYETDVFAGEEYYREDAPEGTAELAAEISEAMGDVEGELFALKTAAEVIDTLETDPLDLYGELCGMEVEIYDRGDTLEIRARDGERITGSRETVTEWVLESLTYMCEACITQGEVKEWNDAVGRVRERS